MVKKCSRVYLTVFALMLSVFVCAQDSLKNEKPQMADALRTSGKIYVVVTVLVIILIGLFLYLLNTDKKMSRIEKKMK
jgi:K+-transporting ATPase A subunit